MHIGGARLAPRDDMVGVPVGWKIGSAYLALAVGGDPQRGSQSLAAQSPAHLISMTRSGSRTRTRIAYDHAPSHAGWVACDTTESRCMETAPAQSCSLAGARWISPEGRSTRPPGYPGIHARRPVNTGTRTAGRLPTAASMPHQRQDTPVRHWTTRCRPRPFSAARRFAPRCQGHR